MNWNFYIVYVRRYGGGREMSETWENFVKLGKFCSLRDGGSREMSETWENFVNLGKFCTV